ncbi:MAG: Daunorubicin/doxorubicin resistance ATP-binding protein DrrA [Deltaproteobacteria bacterium ADurb.Bin151]|jgi:ABC-2 type transport system ATP-binding protein|nr:ATP-binding cassette domain-containing protein [Smithella sp.]OQB51923.1 MAG: Daunorubicin/doxorubicin resistance ATP-binding protein DrrA [Deltaproteobacteria bacterium ADurb.Bin151]HOQ41724.1 ATP-binding cassette domain-containing protein [Smithellaceae bacterium]HPL65293.1 ATP-binding cassette domain-containing protein [Smithellaceae bacterium]
MAIIEIRSLTKTFGKIRAVRGIDLTIDEGEIFGLLGPNGAGKTTTIGMLCTIIRPTSGTGIIAGFDIVRHPTQVRQNVGIVFQDPTLDTILTGRENLQLHARLYGIPARERNRWIEEMLELVDLRERADDLTKTYSGGMRRRLELARGLLHRPAVLFLDEPTLGLDPQTRARTWEYIRKMAQKEKTTVVLTTHYMEEAQLMCDRIGIIDAGKIIALDTPGNMIDRMGGDIVAINAPNPPLDQIRSLPYVSEIKTAGETTEITMKSAHLHLAGLLALIRDVRSVEMRKPTLNDVFIKLTGRDIREDNAENGGSWIETIARYKQRGK